MKLYYGPFSPYVQMVRMTAMAKGVYDKIELINARGLTAEYERLNPLNKVPVLLTDDGQALIESRLICQYLDGLTGDPKLYPFKPNSLRQMQQREALVHGVLDAVILRFNEARRIENERSRWWDERQQNKINLGLRRIESEIAYYTNANTILPIVLGCLIEFMENTKWSLVTYHWKPHFPVIATWYEEFSKTPIMKQTVMIE